MTHFFYGKTYIFFISTSKWAICWLANRENGIWCWFWWRWIVKFTFLFSGCVCPVLFLIFCFVRIFYSLIVRLNDAKICVWWKCLWLLLFLFFLHIKFVLIYANEVLSALLIYSFFFSTRSLCTVYMFYAIFNWQLVTTLFFAGGAGRSRLCRCDRCIFRLQLHRFNYRMCTSYFNVTECLSVSLIKQ